MRQQLRSLLAVLAIVSINVPIARAADIAPAYSSDFSIGFTGGVPGLPGRAGGITLKDGDMNTLLIGGNANTGTGGIYQIGITRDANNHITGFSGTATKYANAPYNDGGLAYGPGGVLFYTTYYGATTGPNGNNIGQLKPGSTSPDKVTNLTGLGVSATTGTLAFAPDGSMKILEYWSTGDIFTSTLSPDGSGTYNIQNVTQVASYGGKGPEGLAYIPGGSPLFSVPGALISDYFVDKVYAFDIDANYNPIISTKRLFVDNLTGAQGAYIDPYSGDFLFSQFATPASMVIVRGFNAPVPEPSTWILAAIASGVMAAAARRRMAKGKA